MPDKQSQEITTEDLALIILRILCHGCRPYDPNGSVYAACPVHGSVIDPEIQRIKKILDIK